ncbi:MAG TPA: hypothetical protein VFX28_17470, partial [Methylomirabilota bacterium]|nr:hypothetical protein [Methylomirabilota bacterium]
AVARELRDRGQPAVVSRPQYLTCKAIEAFCEAQFGSLTDFVTHLDPQVYLHALMADWLEHYTRALRRHEGRILVCDRYLYDVFAQILHYGADPSPALKLAGYFPAPALSVFLETSPEEAAARIQRRGEPPRALESLDNLRQLVDVYARVRQLLSWRPLVTASTFDVSRVMPEVLDAVTAGGCVRAAAAAGR